MKKNKEILTGLKKANAHLKKVVKMIEDEKYCIEILQQNLAVIGLLRSVNNKILKQHLNSCFAVAMRGTDGKKKQEMIDEILQISKIK
jgi:DNA-binding FrmR family transcriptional regulator